jgi:hypothetical protein
MAGAWARFMQCPMFEKRNLGRWLWAIAVSLSLLLTGCDLPQVSAEERTFLNLSLDFLHSYTLPKQEFQGVPVGGLSALTYDRQRNLFYAISDDRSEFGPARFYTLQVEVDSGAAPKIAPKITPTIAPTIKQVTIRNATAITNENGQPYAKGEIDPEGISLSPLGTLFISSEGVPKKEIPPFVREFDLKTGQWKRSLIVPERYLPKIENGKQTQGVSDNLGFEALTLNTVSGGATAIEPFRLFTATESALVQDASPEHPTQGASRNRFLHYSIDPTRSLLVSEHLYLMEPPPEGALSHGLVELLAIDQGGHFLSLERSFGSQGFAAKIFQLSTGSATDTSRIETLSGNVDSIQPIRKKLLLDLTTLGIPLDNLEGMTFGPQLPGGKRSILLISDDNFRREQVTQVLLFQLEEGTPRSPAS